MEKAGMREIRTFHADWPVRIPGDEHGDVEYAITRAEWEADRVVRLRTTGRMSASITSSSVTPGVSLKPARRR